MRKLFLTPPLLSPSPARAGTRRTKYQQRHVGSLLSSCVFVLSLWMFPLNRERERLEKEAEEKAYVRHEEAYRRTVEVGRYELSLDILQEDLDHARDKLVTSGVVVAAAHHLFLHLET